MTTKKPAAKKAAGKKTAPAKKMGRPSGYSDDLADVICARLVENGGRSLRSVCADDDMPSLSTAMRWLSESEHFQQQYARATDVRAEIMAEDTLEIADDARNDYIEKARENGELFIVADQEHIARSRLRIDTRKWLLSKMAPKKYGDKVQAEVSGPGGAPVEMKVVVELVRAEDGRPA